MQLLVVRSDVEGFGLPRHGCQRQQQVSSDLWINLRIVILFFLHLTSYIL